ncbi:MAG: hypothetical protein IPJ40_18255 [Saprospirales bacterium]|nr:hypothetical protein [Saprospirales bacterium]
MVNHGKRYDFKSNTLRNPRTSSCPFGDITCKNTVTLGTSPGKRNCFPKDLPGNLFYTSLGRYARFSKLALQLGSQYAQFENSGRWDPPEDTHAVNTGFDLEFPFTEKVILILHCRGMVIFSKRKSRCEIAGN